MIELAPTHRHDVQARTLTASLGIECDADQTMRICFACDGRALAYAGAAPAEPALLGQNGIELEWHDVAIEAGTPLEHEVTLTVAHGARGPRPLAWIVRSATDSEIALHWVVL